MSAEYIFSSLGTSLLLTIMLELVFALIFKVHGRTLIIVILVNVLTNPAVVVLYLLLCRYFSLPALCVVPVLEIGAVICEAAIYKYRCEAIRHPFIFAFSANIFSYFCGALIGALL